jgi:hypothetical protein
MHNPFDERDVNMCLVEESLFAENIDIDISF